MTQSSGSILVVDDHPVFIDALHIALRPLLREPRFLAAKSLAEAETILAAQSVALTLLDLMLPDADGLEGVSRLRALKPKGRLVVVSGRDDAATIALAKVLGADGFISKGSSLVEIQTQLARILGGETLFPLHDAELGASAIESLSPAQGRILAASATGKLNKQIAFEMGLSEATVKSHFSAIFKKLDVLNRTQAILVLNGQDHASGS